jgi:hypothetical protein
MPFEFIRYILAGAAVGLTASILGALLQKFLKADKTTRETLETRVDALTTSLRDATQLISQIESEIETRSELATRLRDDVERYDQLKKLSAPEVEAVAQVLRGELKSEGTKSFWKGVIVNFVFFLVGAAASFLISRIAH